MKHLLKVNTTFELENGAILPVLEIAYHTYGTYNPKNNNVIWICHALTANSDAEDWWHDLVGPQKLFNPSKHFIVCANILGSPYGTTNPLSVNPETGEKYYRNFPDITIRDMVNAHILLREHLGIKMIHTMVGGSIGSFQAIEWAIKEPDLIQNLIVLAGGAITSPWLSAFNETQRMAIRADKSFYNDNDTGGIEGLKVARAIALLSYRNNVAYNNTQPIGPDDNYKELRVFSYQQYQGEKLARRFDAYAYYTLTYAVDSHNVGKHREGLKKALSKIKAKTLIIGINSDYLFPYNEQQLMYENINNANLEMIESDFGHDGFLIEYKKIERVINKYIQL